MMKSKVENYILYPVENELNIFLSRGNRGGRCGCCLFYDRILTIRQDPNNDKREKNHFVHLYAAVKTVKTPFHRAGTGDKKYRRNKKIVKKIGKNSNPRSPPGYMKA